MRIIVNLSKLRPQLRGVALAGLARADELRQLGFDVRVHTYDYVLDFAYIAKSIVEGEVVHPDLPLLNLHEFLITTDAEPVHPEQETPLQLLSQYKVEGTVQEFNYGPTVRWRGWALSSSDLLYQEFYRPDGSIYLRAVAPERSLTHGASAVEWINQAGQLCGRFRGIRDLWALWMRWGMSEGDILVQINDGAYVTADRRDMLSNVCDGPTDVCIRIAHGATVANPDRENPLAVASYIPEEANGRLSALVFNTGRQRDEWERLFPGSHPTVAIPHSHRNQDSYCSSADEIPRLVTVASLFPLKRVQDVITAFEKARQRVSDLRLQIIGEGPVREDLEKLVNDLDITEAVEFLGYQSGATRFFEGAAASIVTSERETFSMPIVESMSFGTPVVAYDVQYGPSSLVENGKNGFLVPDGDVEALAKGIVSAILAGPELRDSTWRASAEYSSERVMSRWVALIEDVTSPVSGK